MESVAKDMQSQQQDSPPATKARVESQDNAPAIKRGFSIFGAREMISIGLAAVAAYVMSHTSVLRRFFTNVHKPALRRAIIDLATDPNFNAADHPREAGIIQKFKDLQNTNHEALARVIVEHGETPKFAKKLGEHFKEAERAENGLFRNLGIKGPIKAFIATKPHQQWEVVLGGVIAAAASLGAVYGLANNKQLTERFRQHEKNQAANNAQDRA